MQLPPSSPPAASAPSWDAFLARAKAQKKADVVPERPTRPETLPQSRPLRNVVLQVADPLDPGVKLAVDDLAKYLQAVTGRPVPRITRAATQLPADATIIAIGQGPRPTGKEAYAIQATRRVVAGQTRDVVEIDGSDKLGTQYGIYRLMALTGQRAYHYMDPYTPPVGQAVLPVAGFTERYAPPANMTIRGFAPHLYHPIPLSIAFHQPSPEHLQMLKQYIDWAVANGQNSLKFELLELDAKHKLLPIVGDGKHYREWLPYAREILDYAHERGIKVSATVAFSEYTSSNVFAVNPAVALYQSFRLDHLEKQILALEKQAPTSPAARRKLADARAKYDKLLAGYAKDDGQRVEKLVDKLMEVPWDDISWNCGTSEFTQPNDDLAIAWMNAAATYLRKKYPSTTTAVSSHIPGAPVSPKYQTPYFELEKYADPGMGHLVHTVDEYGLLDPAPVYGNQDFTHKLKQLYETDPKRTNVYYPETSYWVAHDVSVPLFLPIYMLSRAADMRLIKDLPHLDGELVFTTGWEWGYWLSDYATARMQAHPDEDLTSILDGAFAPFGPAREGWTGLLRDTMLAQQKYLIDEGLMRHLQGADALNDFGAKARTLPVLKDLLHGTNAQPVRLAPAEIMTWNARQLDEFERGELAQVRAMAKDFDAFAGRARALAPQVPAAARRYHDEMADGLQIDALRAREVEAALTAAVQARRFELSHDPGERAKGQAALARAKEAMQQGQAVIAEREKHYRDAPEYTYAPGAGPTMWKDRYLSRVHTGEFWKRTYDEAARLYAR